MMRPRAEGMAWRKAQMWETLGRGGYCVCQSPEAWLTVPTLQGDLQGTAHSPSGPSISGPGPE